MPSIMLNNAMETEKLWKIFYKIYMCFHSNFEDWKIISSKGGPYHISHPMCSFVMGFSHQGGGVYFSTP